MNVSITNACNRRCEYCFQRDWYLSKKANSTTDESVIEMTTEEFAHLCDWAGRLPCLRKLFKNPRAKPDGTKMFCSAFLNDARMCCFFANAIVKY